MISKCKSSEAHRLVQHLNKAKNKYGRDLDASVPIPTAQQELSPHQHRQMVSTVTGLLCERNANVLSEEIKAIVDKIRCKLPKVFYDAVKRATKNSKSSLLALGFSTGQD